MVKTTVTEDSLFKRIYGGRTKVSKRSVRHLLETFLDIKVHTIEQLSTNMTTGKDEHQMVADVLLLINGIDLVMIEMQNQNKVDNKARYTSYESILTMYRNDKGQRYDVGRNIILVFTGYHVRDDKAAIEDAICHRYGDGLLFSDKYVIQFVELVGLSKISRKPVAEMTSKERYRLFIRYMNEKVYPEKKKMIDEIVVCEEEIRMTLSEIMRTTDKKEWPHEFLRWKNEDQIQQEDRIERAKKRERAKEKREFAKLKLKAEEIEKERIETIQKLAEEQSARKEVEQKIVETEQKAALKIERIADLMSQGMSKEEALKQVEMM